MHDPNFNKPKFNMLKELIKKHRKANSEIKASNNPMKYIKDHANMSISGKKGAAF